MNNPIQKIFRCVLCDQELLNMNSSDMNFRGKTICDNEKCITNTQKIPHTLYIDPKEGAISIIECDKIIAQKLEIKVGAETTPKSGK